MTTPAANTIIPYENRLDLTLKAIELSQITNIRTTTALYSVSRATLQNRLRGRITQHDTQVNNRKLTSTEELALFDRIKSLDDYGLSSILLFVQRIVNLLLTQRILSTSVRKN
jgi:hypothetical protein